MRKYVFSPAVLRAVLRSIGTVRTGGAGARDWRFYLSLLASGLTVAVAMGTVHKESQEMAEDGHGS
jgi:hypothetical protein